MMCGMFGGCGYIHRGGPDVKKSSKNKSIAAQVAASAWSHGKSCVLRVYVWSEVATKNETTITDE